MCIKRKKVLIMYIPNNPEFITVENDFDHFRIPENSANQQPTPGMLPSVKLRSLQGFLIFIKEEEGT